MLARSIVAVALSSVLAAAHAAEVEIPRSVSGDKGRYYLLEKKLAGTTWSVLHKRVGPSGTSHTRTEINCSNRQLRVIAEGEDDPKKMTVMPTKWFDLVEGSSKSDLFVFVCRK